MESTELKKQRKRKRNKSAKGGEFERDTCRRLSAWWVGNPTADVIFWRTSQSGGRVTFRAKKGKGTTRAHCGDIAALDGRGMPLTNMITWELKNGYRDASIHELLDRPDDAALQPYEQWVDQAVTASHNASTRYWAIVHHRSFREDLMVMPRALWDALGCTPDTIWGPVSYIKVPIRWNTTVGSFYNLVAVPFERFLEGVTPKEVRNLSRAA